MVVLGVGTIRFLYEGGWCYNLGRGRWGREGETSFGK